MKMHQKNPKPKKPPKWNTETKPLAGVMQKTFERAARKESSVF